MTPINPPPRNASAGHGASRGQGPAHHYTHEELHNEDVAHEHSDINVRAIVISALILGAIGVVTLILMYGVFLVLENQASENDPPQSPLAAPAVQMPPDTTLVPTFGNAPQPQLLTNEYVVLRQHRRVEQQQLTSYGWVDEAGGVARIPISEAKKLIVERGLPSREGIADPTLGTARPSRGEASGGRTVSGPPRGAGLPEIGSADAPQPQQPPPQKGGH